MWDHFLQCFCSHVIHLSKATDGRCIVILWSHKTSKITAKNMLYDML